MGEGAHRAGGDKNNAPMFGAFGVLSEYEPVAVPLTTTNVP